MDELTRALSYPPLSPRENLNTLTIARRRPVQVSVNRIYVRSHARSTDINNNQARILLHPENPIRANTAKTLPFDLPPVSLFFAVLQLFFYTLSDQMKFKVESDVYVSWQKVIDEGEVWRIFFAQFFHFFKVHMFFNVVTLMALGRFLEKKIKPYAYAGLIMLMSVISNLLFILIVFLSSGSNNEYTVGFSTAMFSLRMVHIFTMDNEANNGKGDPNLIFGFLPMHLPPLIAPWQPLLETIFFDVAIIGRSIANNVAGMCAGLVFPYLMKHYRNHIMYPRNPVPPPPKFRLRRRTSESRNNNYQFSRNSVRT